MTKTRWQVMGGVALGAVLTLGFAATMQHASAQKSTNSSTNDAVAQELPPPPGGFGGQGGFGGPPGGGQGGFGGQGGPPGGGFGGGGFGGPGGGQGRPGGMMGGMMGPGGGASITATEKYVYVLRGDQLLQYSVDGLKLTAKTTLPRPEGAPSGGFGGNGRPGGN